MTADPETAIETMRARIGDENAEAVQNRGPYEDISDADADALLDIADRMRLLGESRYSHHQREFILRRAVKLAREVGGIHSITEDRDVVEDMVTWINGVQTTSSETNKDYRVALRNAAKLLAGDEEIPDSAEWVPGGYPDTHDPAPDPVKMLRWEDDIKPMIDACLNARDRALVAVAFDLGARPGELFDLTPGAITDHKYGKQVTVDGKRGQRSPILIPSEPWLRKWLEDHPGGATDPLWCKLKEPGGISANRIRDILRKQANRAGVDKPATPTNFRKSSASFLASQGVSQAHLEDHHGWTRGSSVAARYIAVFDEANEREIARAHGLDVAEDEADPTGPIVCPRCEQKTPRDEDACVWCDRVLSQSAAEKLAKQRETALSDMTEAEAELTQALANVEQHLGEQASVRIELTDE